MGLFEKIFRRPRTGAERGQADGIFRTLTAYTPAFTSWDGQLYEAALIRAAVDARARHVSKLSVEITGSARPRLQTALRAGPNAWQTWGQWLYRLSTILDLQGTAFIVPVFASDGLEVTGYFPVLPDQCQVVQYRNQPWLRYRFSGGQTAAVELEQCGIMTRFQYRDDLFGTDNRALTPTMELINIQTQAVEEAVNSSATYRFMARVGNFSKAEDLARERRRFTAENLKEGGGVLLFPNTYQDIRQIESKPYTVSQPEMAEIRENVYDYFGVNGDILQNKAYGDAWSAFYEGATEPFAIQCSDVMTRVIFTARERRQGNSFALTSNRLQFMSAADKLQVSAQMADRGILNRDEIRAIWNLPPLPDGAGQAYTIRGEYYLLGEDGTVKRRPEEVEREIGEISGEIAAENGEENEDAQ